MSSPAGLQPSSLLWRWMPSSSRAGVILSGSPGVESACSSPGPEGVLDDSFCSHFAPLPASCSSSCTQLDSVGVEESRVGAEDEASSRELDSIRDATRLPLIAKLEQLKQLQQRMQAQLKARQLEQMQILQSDQQVLLGMAQPGTAGYGHEFQASHRTTEASQLLQTHYTVTQTGPGLHQHREEEETLESGVWNHEPSMAHSTSRHDGGDDEDLDEASLHSEDQTMQRNESKTEPQDRPIRSGMTGKTFEEMLEEQLKRENEEMTKSASTEAAKVKRPFLRRGEGLARFTKGKATVSSRGSASHSNAKPTPRLDPPAAQGLASRPHKSTELKRPSSKPPTSTNVVVQRKTAVLSKENVPQSKALVPAVKTFGKLQVLGAHQWQNVSSEPRPVCSWSYDNSDRKLETQLKTVCDIMVDASKEPGLCGTHQGQNVSSEPRPVSSWSYNHSDKVETQSKTIRDSVIDASKEKPSARVMDAGEHRACIAENSFDMWLAERGEHWDKDHQRECVELGEFELLERAADEISFSSNSSFVGALLQGDRRRLSSTPVKLPPRSTLLGRRYDAGTGPVQPGASKSLCLPTPPEERVAVNAVHNVPSECSEEEECKIIEEDSDASVCSATVVQQPVVVSNPSFSHCFQVSAPPYNKHSYQDRDDKDEGSTEGEEEDLGESTVVDARGQVDFDDEDTWNEAEDSTCSSSTLGHQSDGMVKRKVAVSKGADTDGHSAMPINREPEPPPTCQLVAKLFPALKPKPNPPPPKEQGPGDALGEQEAVRSRLLRERLVELENEIERFKQENRALSRLREENQEAGENLRKERAEFQKKMAEEHAKWEEFKREETKKLQREKKLFEKHAAAARARPDKQERDEIQSLKQQLNVLQDDIKKREARWSSTHHRLRQQVEALGTENATLRDQVRMLEKLRLSAWKNAEREQERGEKGRSSTSSTMSSRTNSKSPSCSVKYSPPQSGSKTESPEVQFSQKSSTHSPDNLKPHWQKEPSPVSAPYVSSVLPMFQGGLGEDSQQMKRTILLSSDSQQTMHNIHLSSETDGSGEDEGVTGRSEMDNNNITHSDGKIEKVLPDGGRLIVFPNGTRKELSVDGLSIKVTFFNGDIKHVMPDQRVIYYYAEAQTTHTTYPDGMEVLQFPNNQIEKHFPDGRKEITFPDQTVKNLYPDGTEESVLADGTIIQQNPDGSKEIRFNTGQRELHTVDFKRREYPDGTVKTVYSDGRQETRYPTGRVRLKDPQGRVVMGN